MFVIFFELGMAFLMIILGLFFFFSKGRALRTLTGYEGVSKEGEGSLDEESLSQIYGKWFMIMAIPFIIGALVAFFTEEFALVMSWMGWILLFLLLLWKRKKSER